MARSQLIGVRKPDSNIGIRYLTYTDNNEGIPIKSILGLWITCIIQDSITSLSCYPI